MLTGDLRDLWWSCALKGGRPALLLTSAQGEDRRPSRHITDINKVMPRLSLALEKRGASCGADHGVLRLAGAAHAGDPRNCR